MSEGGERSEQAEGRQRWRMARDLGMLSIAAIAAVYIVAMRGATPSADTASPAAPGLSPEARALNGAPGVTIYNSGQDAYSVTLGNTRGVTELSVRQLGGSYANAEQFMELLKQRDPELHAWAQAGLFRREAEQVFAHNDQPHTSEQKIVGATRSGMPVKEGETIVVPQPPQRSSAEVEAEYDRFYAMLRDAYETEQRTRQLQEDYQKRKAAKRAAAGSAAR